MRTGPLPTMSRLMEFFRYNQTLEQRFGVVIDDKIFEDPSSDGSCPALELAVGLGCGYFLIKGATKPERVAKLWAYQEIVKTEL